MSDLLELAEAVERGVGLDDKLDVLIEIALFEPDDDWKAVKANNAGTKIVYTTLSGKKETYWALEWTDDRRAAAAALRARALAPRTGGVA